MGYLLSDQEHNWLKEENHRVEDVHEHDAPAEGPPGHEEEKYEEETHEKLEDVGGIACDQSQDGQGQQVDGQSHQNFSAFGVLAGGWFLGVGATHTSSHCNMLDYIVRIV